jgi:hypothetical protein
MIEKIRDQCKQLRLATVGQHLDQVLEQSSVQNWSCAKTIAHLFDIELEQRRQNRIGLRFKQSNLLEKPTIDQFDFDHHGSRKKQKTTILNLLALEFYGRKWISS